MLVFYIYIFIVVCCIYKQLGVSVDIRKLLGLKFRSIFLGVIAIILRQVFVEKTWSRGRMGLRKEFYVRGGWLSFYIKRIDINPLVFNVKMLEFYYGLCL